MKRAVCIHGHFYQPPRENPWLEAVELQDSAAPYHDWNERIAAECYRPNSAARILDDEGRLVDIVNNFTGISFNVGPTLLSWLEKHEPETYRAILTADRRSRKRFSGHGAAIAQCYNHLIMPLAERRDKRTQVRWGVADFVHRFGRRPEGIWLPETAVDLETLEVLAEEEIAFTILAPHQAARVRALGDASWHEVDGGRIDPRRPYLCRLPSGRKIVLFFYDGPISRDVAFAGLLRRGDTLAGRLLGAFAEEESPQLVHIATDGETYGHHHRFGEMALAYGLDLIDSDSLAEVTVYGEFLDRNPPTFEVEIAEGTAWSCAHGVERWRADCGCRIGDDEGGGQAWRKPLREALDWLRRQLDTIFEAEGAKLFADPWRARDAYITVILDRREANVDTFLGQQGVSGPSEERRRRALQLLEMQRHGQLMFTSCGWFFDEVSGIETVQILAYAGRALQLAGEVGPRDLEPDFLRRLEKIPCRPGKWRDGADVYRQRIRPMRLDLIRVAAHHAIAGRFGRRRKTEKIYAYRADDAEVETLSSGAMELSLGRTRIRSGVTGDAGHFAFVVLHLGGHKVNAGLRDYGGEEAFAAMRRSVRDAFEKNDIPEVIRQMDHHFGSHNYNLWHLFRDEQRRIVNHLMDGAMAQIDAFARQVFDHHLPLLHFLQRLEVPVPRPLATLVQQVANRTLRELLEQADFDAGKMRKELAQAAQLPITLDEETLGRLAGELIVRQMASLSDPERRDVLLPKSVDTVEALLALPFPIDLWPAQKSFLRCCRPWLRDLAGAETDPGAASTRQHLVRLAALLRVAVD